MFLLFYLLPATFGTIILLLPAHIFLKQGCKNPTATALVRSSALLFGTGMQTGFFLLAANWLAISPNDPYFLLVRAAPMLLTIGILPGILLARQPRSTTQR